AINRHVDYSPTAITLARDSNQSTLKVIPADPKATIAALKPTPATLKPMPAALNVMPAT
ncbi:hypothetical protein ACLOJK_023108, partial [Asimina triloba]